MKIYKVYSQCMMGFEGDTEYKKSIDKATQYFNDLIRKTLREVDIIDKDDFSDSIANFKDNIENCYKDCKVICRKYPLLIYQQGNKKIAVIDYLRRTSYEYQEYGIESELIVLEEIELLE